MLSIAGNKDFRKKHNLIQLTAIARIMTDSELLSYITKTYKFTYLVS